MEHTYMRETVKWEERTTHIAFSAHTHKKRKKRKPRKSYHLKTFDRMKEKRKKERKATLMMYALVLACTHIFTTL